MVAGRRLGQPMGLEPRMGLGLEQLGLGPVVELVEPVVAMGMEHMGLEFMGLEQLGMEQLGMGPVVEPSVASRNVGSPGSLASELQEYQPHIR